MLVKAEKQVRKERVVKDYFSLEYRNVLCYNFSEVVMRVLVLNGSPKGKKSVTLCSIKFLEKVFSKDEFSVFDVGQQIRAFERENKFNEFKTALLNADMVVACYPVYTFLAPAQLHRFFEIMAENGVSLDGKFATQLTTSKRFYDVTAHGTVKKILADFGGKYIGGLSADMEDLTLAKGRDELISWWKFVRYQVANEVYERITVEKKEEPFYERRVSENTAKSGGKSVLIVTDSKSGSSLENMIDDFRAIFPFKTSVLNLSEVPFKCGCLGCLKCTSSGECAVKDGFSEILKGVVNKADAVVTAFEITNHSLSSLYKTFFDRQFVNGHRPVTAGKPTGYIVSGNLSSEDVLKTYIDAKSAVGGNYNCGVVCDENNAFDDLTALSNRLAYALENDVKPEHNFYEIGGMKIFRDMIWIMRGMMKADYDFYKKNGLLDFPQKKRGQMLLMIFLGKLLKSKSLNKKMPNMMSDGMLIPYEKAVKDAKPID